MTHPTLTQSHGPAFTRLYSIGAARGEHAVPNDDLVGPIDSSDEWIQQRTGIITRTRAGADVSALDLSTAAAEEAIAKSGVARISYGPGPYRAMIDWLGKQAAAVYGAA